MIIDNRSVYIDNQLISNHSNLLACIANLHSFYSPINLLENACSNTLRNKQQILWRK